MAAHKDLTHATPHGSWRLRLHAGGQVEVLEHRAFATVERAHGKAVPPPGAPAAGAALTKGARDCPGCARRQAWLLRLWGLGAQLVFHLTYPTLPARWHARWAKVLQPRRRRAKGKAQLRAWPRHKLASSAVGWWRRLLTLAPRAR